MTANPMPLSKPQERPFAASENQVMISYSRRNRSFAKALVDNLNTIGVDAWLDEQDISPGQRWKESIRQGIVQARAVVAIISPHSLVSPPCAWEVELALERNIPLIPVVFAGEPAFPIDNDPKLRAIQPQLQTILQNRKIKDVLGKEDASLMEQVLAEIKTVKSPENPLQRIDLPELWKKLQELNILGFAEAPTSKNGQYEARVKEIAEAIKREAIDNYSERRKKHHHLRLSADKWQSQHQSKDLLLQGSELRAAAQWLKDERNHIDDDPHSTYAEINAFISASQTRRSQRSRQWRVGSGIIIAALAVLSLALYFQRDRANDEADRANDEARRANIASTQTAIQRDLAIERLNGIQRVQQMQAVEQLTARYTVGTSPNTPLILGPNLWITNQGDGTLLRLRADTAEQLGDAIRVGANPDAPFTAGGYVWVTSSTQITRIALAGEQNPLTPEIDAIQIDSVPLDSAPKYVQFGGAWLWVIERSGLVTAIHMEHLDTTHPAEVRPGLLHPAADNTHLWIIDEYDWVLQRIHPQDGITATLPLTEHGMTPIIADDSVWLIDRETAELQQIDATTATEQARWDIGGNPGEPLFDDTYLWIASTNDVVQFDPSAREIVRRWPTGSTAWQIYREGDRLWALTSGHGLVGFDLPTRTQLPSTPEIQGNVTLAADGAHLWVINATEDSIVARDVNQGELRYVLTYCKQPSAPSFDGTNMWFTCRATNELIRIPALLTFATLGTTGNITTPRQPVYDGHYMWVVLEDEGKLVQFDGATGMVLQDISIGLRGDEVQMPFFDGRYIWITSDSSGSVTRVDPHQNPSPVEIITLGGTQLRVTMLGARLWFTSINLTGPDLFIVNPDTLEIIAQHEMGMGALQPVAETGDSVAWVTGYDIKSTLNKIDIASGMVLQTTTIDAPIGYPVLVDDTVWVASIFSNDLYEWMHALAQAETFTGDFYRIQRTDGTLLDTVSLGPMASRPIYAEGLLWVTHSTLDLMGANDEAIVAIDPQSQERVGTWPLCNNVTEAFFDGRLMWFSCINLLDEEAGHVLVIDPQTLEVIQHYENLGRSAWPALRIGDMIWLVFQSTGNTAIFRAATGELVALVSLGTTPSRPVADNQGYLWVANANDNTVQRIYSLAYSLYTNSKDGAEDDDLR
ncbi:MAG: TIR domain-containing protein [Anaerolineae bacterium]|nr:TIR domain-containing protein [Anaerolineae bacterium]